MKTSYHLATCACILAAGMASAVGLSGDVSTSVLVTDRPTTTDEPVKRIPLYQTFRYVAGDLGSTNLSLVGSYRYWYDLQGDADDASDMRVVRSYLRWYDPDSRLDVRLGRQFVSEGVGRTALDGVFLGKRFDGGSSGAAYIGLPLRKSFSGDEAWQDNKAHQWGARYRWSGGGPVSLGVSYTEMTYDGDTGLRLVGASGTFRIGECQTLRLRADYDAADGAVDRVHAGWLTRTAARRVYSLDVNYRQARLWAFSPLRDRAAGGFTRVTASMLTPVSKNTRLYIAASGLDSGGEPGGTADIGVNWHTLRMGYLFTSTASVTGSGAYLQGSYRVTPKLTVGGRTNWTHYELDQADDASQTIGSAAYVTFRPIRKLGITAEVRETTTDLYSYQFEGLLSLRYRFAYLAGMGE